MEYRIAEGAGNSMIVRVEGDLDLYSAPRFAAAMMRLVAVGGARVVLDMEAVGYLDSTGVGAIIRLLQAARSYRSDLAFAGVSGAPRRVLEMSGILRLMREVPLPKVAP